MGRTLLDRLARFLWPLAVANLVANIGIVVTGGGRPAHRLRPRVPDVAALHRRVVRRPR